ncbi:hypothetical protein GCM10010387_22480 [Streptomyces inusitatus]|uniref:Uncharacterized protein n=1 Tax=Streptomyces inusitatus TaxID=68221 RepID=A0A918Q204_9ACTN|nr:DUF6221 family protein [Streptomyces inusitatus]GGZ28521.1 hypothetical protein GCM10010387_22480 [Streptomyces inusitatus]
MSDMTNDLVEFLRARLDEDEAAARAAAEPPSWVKLDRHPQLEWSVQYWDAPDRAVVVAEESSAYAVVATEAGEGEEDADARVQHIARHDPARVLAEIEATRRIIGESAADCSTGCTTEHSFSGSCALRWMGPVQEENGTRWAQNESLVRVPAPFTPLSVLRLLALPYADHPDYRDGWRP